MPSSEYAGSFGTSGTGVVTDNDQISPEGVQNAFTINDTDNAGYFRIEETAPTTSGQKHTASVFIKKASAALTYWPALQWDTSYKYCIFNNYTGTYSLASSGTDYESVSVEDFSTYWRLSLTGEAGSSSERFAIWPAISTDGTSISVGATGSNTFYGAQVEVGTYHTSYIPTYGTSNSRNADSAYRTGVSSLIGQTEGTLFLEFEIGRTPTSTDRVLILNDGTSNERIGISLGGTGLLYAFVVDNNVTQCEIIRSSTTAGTYKAAFAYKANDFVFYVNGVQVGTDTAGTIPSCSRYDLGQQLGASELGGRVNQSLLFKTRLTNAQLAELTTL
jgi:hypothetical protein